MAKLSYLPGEIIRVPTSKYDPVRSNLDSGIVQRCSISIDTFANR
ncbi:hypothetical protein C8J37_10922 [Rhizobium sp. PP-WC-1G-195]|nr:hypothetical protein C8J37_10922 [Rhizobium sp. PP-WC-1G-195]